MLQNTDILWAARSSNVKTGDVPTAWVGLDRAACLSSCTGCKLAPKSIGGDGSCYSHSGSPAVAASSIRKAAARGLDRSLAAALNAASRAARMVRYTAIGDGGRVAPGVADSIVETVRAAGLSFVGYTHHWREPQVAADWRGRLMASCDNLAEADDALAAGWRATAVVPEDHPARSLTPGRAATVVVCPAQLAEERQAQREAQRDGGNRARSVTCNDCRLCDASRPGPVIAFRVHGNGARNRS